MSTPNIKTTYEIWSYEDVEHGEAGESGWIDEEGYEFEPDADDYDAYIEDNELPADTDHGDVHNAVLADMVIEFLEYEGVSEPSSNAFHVGTWYIAYGEADYSTGDTENRSFHLYDFTPAQEELIFLGMTE